MSPELKQHHTPQQDSDIQEAQGYQTAQSKEAALKFGSDIWVEELEAFANAAALNGDNDENAKPITTTTELTEPIEEPVEAQSRAKEVFNKIKDAPYWASAQVMTFTMVGKGSNREKRKHNLEKRKQRINACLGALALANVGWNAYKATKGLHAIFQSEQLAEFALAEVLDSSDRESTERRRHINTEDVVDTALDYTYQSADATNHVLKATQPKRRKAAQPRTPKVAEADQTKAAQ